MLKHVDRGSTGGVLFRFPRYDTLSECKAHFTWEEWALRGCVGSDRFVVQPDIPSLLPDVVIPIFL